MSDGHRTSTIPRPRLDKGRAATQKNARASDRAPRVKEAPAAERQGRLKDFTTPIPRDKQLVQKRRGRLALGLIATVIALAIGAALFVLPLKSWMKQRDDLGTRTNELATLEAANNQLQAEVDRLQTDVGIKEAARQEIDFVDAGEQHVTVLPIGPASVALPTGWPFGLVSQIIELRRAEAAAAAVAATSLPPPAASEAAPDTQP